MMHVRAPGIQLDAGPLLWSRIREFSMSYNGASIVIPYVEYYLNSIMNRVRAEYCSDNAQLKEHLTTFIKQEVNHSQYHSRFNKRIFEVIPELKVVADQMTADLKEQRENRSLAFNVAYCVGFESIATFDCKYLYEACDELFDGADPQGANLILWHVAEEFEHRTVCHNAFRAVSGNYFLRAYAALYAFRHIWGAFMRAEAIILNHYAKEMPEKERLESKRRSKWLTRRHMRYLLPRMLRVFVPGYDPAKLPVPARIQAALEFFRSAGPISERVGRHGDAAPVHTG
jgi:predicted metal-dependent hydrolase